MRAEMLLLAEQLEFEEAARLRDKIRELEQDGGAADLQRPSRAPSAPGSRGSRASARGPRARGKRK